MSRGSTGFQIMSQAPVSMKGQFKPAYESSLKIGVAESFQSALRYGPIMLTGHVNVKVGNLRRISR
jgi:hypothetical protein